MTQGFNLGTAHGEVTISTAGVRAAMQEAQGIFREGLRSIGADIQRWGDQMASIGSNLTVLTAPFTAFAATGVRTAATFDATLREIQARTGLTVDEMGRIRDTAIQLGADTAFSAQQSADAFLQLITAGLSLEDAMGLLPTVLDAAAASGEDLGQTADTVTNIMSGFRLGVGDATGIVEAMSRAAASSPASMGQIGEAMTEAAGVATTFGISMDQVAATMAIFANNGIRGANAGTQFRSMVQNMYRPTEAVRGAWDRLGVSLFDVNGDIRDFNTVIVEADAALSLLPENEAAEIMTTIGGSFGIVGFNALRAGTSIGAMQDRMAGQASATDVAAARMDAFNGVIDSLMGSFETLQIEVMTPFMNDVLRPMAVHLTQIINRITEWVQTHPELVSQILRVMSVLSALGPILFGIGKLVSALGGLLAALASPVGLLIAAGAALYVAWQRNFLGIRDLLEPILARLNRAFNSLRDAISGTLDRIRNGQGVFDAIIQTTRIYADNIFRALGLSRGFASAIRNTLVAALEALQTPFENVRNGIQHLIWGFSNFRVIANNFGLEDAIAAIFGRMDFSRLERGMQDYLFDVLVNFGLAEDTARRVTDTIADAFYGLVGVLAPVFNTLRTHIRQFIGVVRLGLDPVSLMAWWLTRLLPRPVAGVIIDALIMMEAGFHNLVNGVQRAIRTLGFFISHISDFGLQEAVAGIFGRGSGRFAETMESALEGILVGFGLSRDTAIRINEAIADAFYGMLDTIRMVIDTLRPLFSEIGTFLSNLFANINFGQVFEIGRTLLSLTSPLGMITTLLRGLGVDFGQIFRDISAVLTRFFGSLNEGNDIFEALGDSVGGEGFFSTLRDMFSSIIDFIWHDVLPALQQLANWFISEALPLVVDFIQTTVIPAIERFIEILVGIWELVAPGLETLFNWFVNEFIPAMVTLVTEHLVPAIESFIHFLASAWEIVGPALENLARWFINDALPVIVEFISGTFIPAIGSIYDILRGIWEAVAPGLLALLDWFINSGLPAIAGFVENVWNNIIQPFFGFLGAVWEMVAPALTSLFNWFVTEAWPQISSAIEDVWHNILEPVIGLLANLWNTVSSALGALLEWFTVNGLPAIRGVLEFLWHNLLEPIVNLLQGIWGVIGPGVNALKDGILAAFGEIIRIANEVLGLINEVISTFQGVQQIQAEARTALANAEAQGVDTGQVVQNAVTSQMDAAMQEGGLGGHVEYAAIGILNGLGLFNRDVGGGGEAGMPYLIGSGAQPEVFIPETNGQFIPNFDQVLAGAGGGGQTFHINITVPAEVMADSAHLDANANRLAQRLREELEAQG